MKKSNWVLFLCVLLAGLMILSLTGCGEKDSSASGEKALEVKFTHVVADSTPKGKAVIRFKELVEKNSNGKIKVSVFPSSQLYGDKEELEQLKANNVQFIAPSVTKLVGFVPAFQIVDMPFLFKNDQAAYNFYDGPTGQKLMKTLEPQGMIGLGWWPNGAKHFTNSKRPLRTPEDFAGLKFRTQSGGVLDAQFKALGAGSQTLAFAEVFTGLNNKTVDGQENTFNNTDTQNYQDVQKYMTISSHGRLDYVVLTNTIFWNSLSPENKKILEDAMKEASIYERQLADEENLKSFEKLKSSGKMEIYTLTEQDREKFIAAMKPVYDSYGDKIGVEYIEAARNSK
jgi:C4-dicarboxylate-binding protein DctP